MMEAKEVCFRHPGAEGHALQNLTFGIPQGSLCCLVGLNGSGKSTLLHLMAGVFEPSSGAFTAGGGTGGSPPRRALLPQDPDVYILGSLVKEDLLLALDPEDGEGRARALSLAATFGLEPLLEEPVQVLSHGQKRQLCLASAMAGQPDILLLDEPFAGLDYQASLVLRDTLRQNKAAGLTQIVSGHDLDLFADLADSFMVLERGELRAYGDGAEVFPQLLRYGVRPPCWWFTGGSAPLWAGA